MAPWLIAALVSSATATVGSALTRSDTKKEAARVAAANKTEAARVQKENKAEAARVEALRKQEQKQAIAENKEVRENYYKNVVSDAQAAGINPLTALRTGAGSAYGSAVQGTIRQPVMRDGVYLEGVYETPTLSRNPIASGLEAGVNVGLAEFTRKQNYSHESRMDELNKSLIRAQIKSMTSELSRDPRLPPMEDRHNYVLDELGQFVLDAEGRAIKRDPFTEKQMQSIYSTIGADGKVDKITSINLENVEGSPSEIKGSLAVIYGGGAVGKVLSRNNKLTGGMPGMDTRGFSNPFGSTRVSHGLEYRWQKSVLDAIR